MCSLSQSLVHLSQAGLLLQAADTCAILKRHHPQLHLTIYSTDTAESGEKKSSGPSQLFFASLAKEDISLQKLCGIYSFHTSSLCHRIYMLTLTVCSAPNCLCALWLRRIFFPGYASLAYIGDSLRLSYSVPKWGCWLYCATSLNSQI